VSLRHVYIGLCLLFVFMAAEGRRLGMTKLWLPAIAAIAVGVSLGLPLFLYMRQSTLDSR
jgi:hypothetical protein